MKGKIAPYLTAWIFCCLLTPVAHAVDPTMEDYTAYPPFTSTAVAPNILIIMDNSGSMNFMAYGYHEDSNYHPDDFGAVISGAATGGDDSTLVDSGAGFTDKVSVGDILHNIDAGSKGIITGVTDSSLEVSGGMSNGYTIDAGDRYWVEHLALKDPNSVEAGYYGYFVPTARYTYSDSRFIRDDAGGEWSGNFLNWLTMRRVDISRKVLIGGLAENRYGDGSARLIGEDPAQDSRRFLKIVEDPGGYSPYGNRHFYKLEDGDLEVYRLNDGEPDLDYSRDFTYTGGGGDDQTLAHYVFDDLLNSNYEIRLRNSAVRGQAMGGVDNPIDQYSSYRYYLYDPNQYFIGAVRPGDYFVNEGDGSTGYVSAVPETVAQLLDSLSDKNWILYDMFNDAGAGDSWLGYPDRTFLPCQDDAGFSDCQADGDLQDALAPLIGHIVIFSTPLVPYGPHGLEHYHFERTSRATRVARLDIKVDRDQTQLHEASDFLDGNIAGVLQKIGGRARFGLEFYNLSEGGDVVEYVGSAMTNLIDAIENKHCDTWTPLAESLNEGIRYFQQTSPYYNSGDFTRSNLWDPYYFNDMSRFVECSKSFILQITDGESTEDMNIPSTLQDYDNDGNDPGTYDSNGSNYLDDVALWAHTTDLRSGLSGTQDISYYTVFAFGQGSALLQDAARNGGFKDVNGDEMPEPPGGDADTMRLEWDEDEDGLPDTYFEAPSGFELEVKIYKAITDILKRTASGTAVSILSTSERGEGTVYQAFFKPQVTEGVEEIKWLGYLQALWVDEKGNLREDTVSDDNLVPSEDYIIRFRFDSETQMTYVDRFTDANGDYQIDSVDADGDPVPDSSVPLEGVQSMWKAGHLLALRNPDTRRIITFADANWDGVVDAGELVDFTLDDLDQFDDFLLVNGEDPDSYTYLGSSDQRANRLVRFIRGEQLDGMRNRQVTVGSGLQVWKLGDNVFSTPTVVTKPTDAYHKLYGDQSYAEFVNRWKDRDGMVYIGANDGMLHAFRAGRFVSGDNAATSEVEAGYIEAPSSGDPLGSEAWAYVPFNLLPHLKWLANPDYTHVFYVDLKAKVGGVKIFPEDMDHPGGWGTVLVGGMRLGGGPYPSGVTIDGEEQYFRSAYFLIDVTDPEDPEVLAEFTHPDLGFATSYPTFTKVGDNWYLIVGSGPTPGTSPPYRYDGTSDQVASIFVLNLTQFMSTRLIREGQELCIIQGADGQAFMADPISVDKLLDYSADVVYVGETSWDTDHWTGRMYRIQTNDSTNPANWQLSTLFQTADHQPITTACSASIGYDSDLWVYFGTGRLYDEQDKSDTHTQSFYGIHDQCLEGGSCNEVSSDDVLDVTSAQVFTDESVSNVSGAENFTELEQMFSGSTSTKEGWKIDLVDTGERSLSKPSILGGAVFFTTYIPDSDICAMGGDGKLYSLYFLTGTAHPKPIIGEDQDTHESYKTAGLGKGMPATLGIHVGTAEGGTGFVQNSTGNIMQFELYPPLAFKSGTVSWKHF
jgi:type IV pilus assembly protein PilY1